MSENHLIILMHNDWVRILKLHFGINLKYNSAWPIFTMGSNFELNAFLCVISVKRISARVQNVNFREIFKSEIWIIILKRNGRVRIKKWYCYINLNTGGLRRYWLCALKSQYCFATLNTGSGFKFKCLCLRI